MIPMTTRQSLQYVKNTNGGATLADFIEDHEPIGEQVWKDLELSNAVHIDLNGRIRLLPKGEELLGDYGERDA